MPTRFAVYLVPPADDPFYHLGSAILGYDVRAGQALPQPPGFQPEWVSKAGQYGFHLTLTEAFECDLGRFPEIEAEISGICACFAPHSLLQLHGGRNEIWDGGTVIVRRFEPNQALTVLHTLLSARLARFVTGSSFERMIAREPGKYAQPYERARMRLFHTPRGLDTWEPHFTLVEPYTAGDAEGLSEDLEGRFEPYGPLEFDGVTLLRQDGERPFTVVRDFALGGAS